MEGLYQEADTALREAQGGGDAYAAKVEAFHMQIGGLQKELLEARGKVSRERAAKKRVEFGLSRMEKKMKEERREIYTEPNLISNPDLHLKEERLALVEGKPAMQEALASLQRRIEDMLVAQKHEREAFEAEKRALREGMEDSGAEARRLEVQLHTLVQSNTERQVCGLQEELKQANSAAQVVSKAASDRESALCEEILGLRFALSRLECRVEGKEEEEETSVVAAMRTLAMKSSPNSTLTPILIIG